MQPYILTHNKEEIMKETSQMHYPIGHTCKNIVTNPPVLGNIKYIYFNFSMYSSYTCFSTSHFDTSYYNIIHTLLLFATESVSVSTQKTKTYYYFYVYC